MASAAESPVSQGAPPSVLYHSFVSLFEWFGQFAIFCWQTLRGTFQRPFEVKEIIRQMDAIGAKSFPVVALAGAATGIVMTMQMRDSMTRFGGKWLLPSVIMFSLIKETGPIITALVSSGRVGAGIGAELGSMRVTEQIDAIEASAVDPIRYLVVTRVIACVLMMPLLTLAADFCGVMCGWVAMTLTDPISLQLFFNSGLKNMTFQDFVPPTFKTAVFGLIIGTISCFQGMNTKGGTEGVGRSATSSVVLSSLFVIVSDVFLVRVIQIFFP